MILVFKDNYSLKKKKKESRKKNLQRDRENTKITSFHTVWLWQNLFNKGVWKKSQSKLDYHLAYIFIVKPFAFRKICAS